MSVAKECRSALHITAIVGAFLSCTMLVPAAGAVALGWGNAADFLVSALVTGFLTSVVAVATHGPPPTFTPRFGFMLVNMLWWISPAICAVPLMLGASHLSFVDGFFEAVSGFTTTGSTVMTGLDKTNRAILLWRSMTQWFGGIGILSLGLILLPFLNAGGMQLFRMESSDRSDKPLPRFADTSRSITLVYLALTVGCMVGYMETGMSAFDAINHAMTTVSTGGYSTHDLSLGYYNDIGTLWVGSVFMALSALPFTLFVVLAHVRRLDQVDPQVWFFFGLIVAAALLLLFGRPGAEAHSFTSFSKDVFNVVSVMTTTGYVAGDYTLWGGLSVPLFFVISFFGGCAGSTAGGLKAYRLVVGLELVRTALKQLSHPNGIFVMRYGKRRVEPEIFRASMVMASAFIASLAGLTIALGACGLDFLTAVSGALTALANVGPGLGGTIGPAGNFSSLPDSAKVILAAGMILGRLEILSVLVLISPTLWRG